MLIEKFDKQRKGLIFKEIVDICADISPLTICQADKINILVIPISEKGIHPFLLKSYLSGKPQKRSI